MSNGIRGIAGKSADKVNLKFKEKENTLLATTNIDWSEIKPKISDSEKYKVLMDQVKIATDKNESLGQLVARLKSLGNAGKEIAEKVIELAT